MILNSIKILLIEDNSGDVRLLQELLRESRHSCWSMRCVPNLLSGLEYLDKENFDIIILDLTLPDQSGIDTFNEVNNKVPKIPIILLTALDDEKLATRAVRKGAQDYLVKGKIDSNLLIRSIRYAIDRKQAEDALRESERRFREMSELLPTIICEIDKDNLITYVNFIGLHIFGYSQADFEAGISAKDLFHPNDRKKAIRNFVKITQGKVLGDIEYRLLHKNGSEIFALVHAASIYRDNKIDGIRASVTDITDRKKLQNRLQKAQKMEAIGTLAGGIAHNFNNLLMGIQGNIALALLKTDSNHPNFQRLKNIEEMVENGSKLTRQLLSYAREGQYHLIPISLNKLIKTTSDAFIMTRKNIKVHQNLADNLFLILADQEQIEQVLLNIYLNSSDAMLWGGDLFLKTKNVTHNDMVVSSSYKPRSGNYVLLDVRDTGVGMGKKTLERIFDPFFTTKGLCNSMGLGLPSAYGIIKAHSGYVEVNSEKGVGTTISIYLPVYEEEKM